jgi:hypothetical protein
VALPATGAPTRSAPAAVAARAVVATRGRVLVRGAGATAATALTSAVPVRSGTVIDATHGAATLRYGAHGRATLSGAAFSVTRSAHGITVRLVGGTFTGCTPRARAKVVRRATVHGAGGTVRVVGRFATAQLAGSATLRLEDRCYGTTVRVARGAVVVRDRRTGRTRVVRAGRSGRLGSGR